MATLPEEPARPAGAELQAGRELGASATAHGVTPKLQNVVATVTLGCELDLKRITLHARNAEYNPKRFAAVIMRIREPKTTALIFASGKMVVTGAKHEEACRQAARKYARIIQKLDFPARFTEFKIQNIVASCDVKFPIRLEGLAFEHCNFASYEPELFPGLIYRMAQVLDSHCTASSAAGASSQPTLTVLSTGFASVPSTNFFFSRTGAHQGLFLPTAHCTGSCVRVVGWCSVLAGHALTSPPARRSPRWCC